MKQILIGLICGVGAVLLVMVIFKGCHKKPLQDNTLQLAVDSMRVHDIQRTQELALRDSIIYTLNTQLKSKQEYIDKVPSMINNVKSTYDKKRNNINNLPIDDQVEFFSEWLSKEDSIQR